MNETLVSVIIPVYNGEKYLDEAIQSVMVQDYQPLDIIVVDDGSTDNSAGIARAYSKIRYIYQRNQGVSAARNAGIAVAKGKFIAFLDADDIWMPDKLRVQMVFHIENPDVGCTVTRHETFLESGSKMPPWLHTYLLHQDEIGFFPSTLVVCRDVFERVGMYDTTYKTGESVDWFARVKDVGIRIEILPHVLLRKRVHDTNLTHHLDDTRANMLKILKASIDRKRA